MEDVFDVFKLGVKLLVVSILSTIIYIIVSLPAVIILPFLGMGGYVLLAIIYIVLIIFITGYVAKKMFNWD